MKLPVNVLFLAAEADPFIKIGGLGDVAGSLPLALRSLKQSAIRKGRPNASADDLAVDVRLVIPLHKAIRSQNLHLSSVAEFDIDHTQGRIPVQVFETHLNGLNVYLVASDLISNDEDIYHPDAGQDGSKYTLFSLAALELARRLNWVPDVLHANDWHTALSVYALNRRRGTERFFRKTTSLLGIHNMPYLGVGAGAALLPFGLEPAFGSALPWWSQDMPLALGLLAADHIVAVSPSYAQEILTPAFGSGLHEFLQIRSQDITGILNGLDVERWEPKTDNALTANYSWGNLEDRLDNKLSLQNELGLAIDPGVPLISMITRLDPQKGVDLLPDALLQLGDLNWQAVILGSGDPTLEGMMRSLEASFPQRVRAVIGFDPKLSRHIYAGADIIMLPSRYEPCGLAQMIAMRYGCIPIAHATGGLKDTILDYADFGQSTGFLFTGASSENLATAVRRALHVYAHPGMWRGLQVRGMQKDFSWKGSAHKYFDLYVSIITSYRQKKLHKVKP
jgi:starch synthase